MSIGVELSELREQVAACGPYAYLLTVTDDGRPHAVSQQIEWDGDALVCGAGRRTAANAERSPGVSLLWPVSGRHGFALIVNGRAEVRVDGDTTKVVLKPTDAVLHKTPEGDGPGCVPVAGR